MDEEPPTPGQRRFRAVGVVVEAKDPLKKMRGGAIYTVNFGTRK